MTKFIMLTRADVRGHRKALPPVPRTPGQKKFQDWAVGDFLVRKTNRHDRLQITAIAGDQMKYNIRVEGVNPQSGDQRYYNSSTLQTAFEHDPVIAIDEPAVAVMPKDGPPIAFNVDHIRNFYPRKDDRQGTRIMTSNGVAYVVLESFDDVFRLTQELPPEEDPEA